MKTKKLFFIVSFIVASVSVFAQQTATEFYVTSPVSVHMPVQGDSINFNGGKFGVSELLKTPVSLNLDEWQYSKVNADTTGYITVDKASKDNLFYLCSTNIRAERFMYGTLKVFSSARFFRCLSMGQPPMYVVANFSLCLPLSSTILGRHFNTLREKLLPMARTFNSFALTTVAARSIKRTRHFFILFSFR